MQISQIPGSKELLVLQTKNMTLAIASGLCISNRNANARVHNPGGRRGKNENGDGYPSVLKFTIINKGEGGSKIANFNLAPDIVRNLFFKLNRLRSDSFDWSADRLHHFKKDKSTGRCPMYRMSIQRISKDSKGEPYRSPWFIKIQEGTAVPFESDTGSVMAQKGSWEESTAVTARLSDDDYFKMLSTCVRYIELWEEAYAIPHIRSGDILIHIAQAKESAVEKDTGAISITKEQAKHNLIVIASSIIELDVQTREICKDYNELLDYYSRLLDADFSPFKLSGKKAQKT